MIAIATLVKPVTSALTHLASSVTYDAAPMESRENGCPYLGHEPYFAPKLTSADKQRLALNPRR
jgi:hypothetical protein